MKIGNGWQSADVGQLNQYFLMSLLYIFVEALVCLTAALRCEIQEFSSIQRKIFPFLCDAWLHGYDYFKFP